MVEPARRVTDVRGRGRRVVGVSIPGAAGAAMRAGALLPQSPGPRGQLTFEEWLTSG